MRGGRWTGGRWFWGLVIGLVLLAGADHARAAPMDTTGTTIPPSSPYADWAWSTWTNSRPVVHDAGDAFWIGGPAMLYRVQKEPLSVDPPIMGIDGLTLSRVDDITSTSDGTVWLAGPEGVIRMAGELDWIFIPLPEGATVDAVAGIAATADGHLWVTDALPDGQVYHYSMDDGEWSHSANPFAAAEANHARLLGGGLGENRIWTVHDGRIWHGFSVLDGGVWQENRPADSDEEYPTLRVDIHGALWSINGRIYAPRLWRRDAESWTLVASSGTLSSDGNVWQMREYVIGPSQPSSVYLVCATDCYEEPIPISGTLHDAVKIAAADAMWFFDDSGITRVGFTVPPSYSGAPLPHEYFYGLLGAGDTGNLYTMRWVWTTRGSTTPHVWINRHDDRGTSRLNDDILTQMAAVSRPEAIAVSAGEHVWSVSRDIFWPPYMYQTSPPKVALPDKTVAFPAWPASEWVRVHGLFIQGDDRVVFDTNEGVLTLDTRSTIDNFDDDRWEMLTPPNETNAAGDDTLTNINLWSRSRAILDAQGGLWYRDGCTVYRREGDGWTPRFTHCGLVDLIPSNDSRVFALSLVEGIPYVHVIWPEGYLEMNAIADLLQQDRALVQSVHHSNLLWTVAPDGAVWYIEYPAAESDPSRPWIIRDDGDSSWTIPLPVDSVDAFGVDAYGHLWLTSNRSLYRFSPRLTLVLESSPQDALLLPGATGETHVRITTGSLSWTQAVLTVHDLSPEITPDFQLRMEAPLSMTVPLAYSVAPTPGLYDFTVTAQAGLLRDEVTVTARVVDEIDQVRLPFITRR